jgi:outer membrane protein OmpA-like peptidoglycan-associated protein
VLPAARNLQVVYEAEGYLPQSENINLKNDAAYFEEYKAVKLDPLKAGATVTLNNVFFGEDKTTIDNLSKPELQRVAGLLRKYPGMKIELTDIIIARNNAKFNKHLARGRAKELKQYFVKEGIGKKRVDASGKRQKPPKVKETKPEKRKPKTRNPAPPKDEKPTQVVVMKISEIKEIKD